MEIYVVKQGDTVDSIAASLGIGVEQLLWENELEPPYRLAVGQALYISGAPEADRRELYSFGYAYPFIGAEPLEAVLPFLTDIYVFSYGFTGEGNLVYPASDDSRLIQEAVNAGVGPVMTLTPLGADGRFNSNLVTILLQSEEAQERLIWEVGSLLLERGFTGVDIDFEYVRAEDREPLAAFAARMTRVLNTFGYQVSAALAPKTSADQRGVLYEGIDYSLLGAAVNRVMLMTYEWGYSQGPPMAVAPIHMVRRVVDYAVSAIPREKISLGIPNYGYDWPLPYERGVTRARTLGLHEAVQLAIFYGAEIQFDEQAQSPYFYYWQYGIRHEVWFEDVRSLKAKYDLILEYGLTGAGFWQLMRFFRPGWLMMREMFSLRKNP